MRPLQRTGSVLSILSLASGCSAPLLYEGRGDLAIEPLEMRLVRITEGGCVPPGPLRLTQHDGGVAFLNDTRDRLVTIIFPERQLKELRCSYTRGFIAEGGVTRTPALLPPGGLASICLHDAGALALEAHGAAPEPFRMVIDVRPDRDHAHDGEERG